MINNSFSLRSPLINIDTHNQIEPEGTTSILFRNDNKNLVKPYQWVLFDADDTLFPFDSFKGLQLMFSRYNIEFTASDYQDFQLINKPLWVKYQNNEITANDIQCQRFNNWAIKLNTTSEKLNEDFLVAMSEVCQPFDGVVDLLNDLRGKVKLGIITNGFTALHKKRLLHNNLAEYFDILVVSEEVGCAKPNPTIFQYALNKMDNPNPKNVIMIGDTLESDIIGGQNIGFDTCWINLSNKPLNSIEPTFQVSSFTEINKVLFKKLDDETI